MARTQDSVGVAVVGAGHWGDRHAHAYSAIPEARLVGICDVDADLASSVASRYGALRAYSHLDEVLADPDVTAVSIVLPDHLHHDAAIACLEAGRHLLIEKPLATTVAEAQSIASSAELAHATVMVNFTNRWNAPLRMAKDYLEHGAVNSPRYAYVRMNNTIHVPTQWLHEPEKTSVLWWIGSHAVDLVRWLFQDEVTSVSAVAGYGILTKLGIAAADFFVTTLNLSSGGVAVIENNWTLPNEWPGHVDVKVHVVTNNAALEVDPYHHRAVEVFGGSASPDADRLRGHGTLERPDLFYDHSVGGLLQGAMINALKHFISCVIQGAEPDVTVKDGVEVTRIIEAATRAAQTGSPVVLRS